MTIVSFFLSALLCLSCLSIALTQTGLFKIIATIISSASFGLFMSILIYWIVKALIAIYHKYR